MTQMRNYGTDEPDVRHIAGWKLGQGDKEESDRTYVQKIRCHYPLDTSGVIFSQTLSQSTGPVLDCRQAPHRLFYGDAAWPIHSAAPELNSPAVFP